MKYVIALLLVIAPVVGSAIPSEEIEVCSEEERIRANHLRSQFETEILTAKKFWRATDGASSLADAYEAKAFSHLIELASIKCNASIEAAKALILDPRINWDGGTALRASDILSKMGKPLSSALVDDIQRSKFANQIVECIESGEKTCI